MHGPRFSKSSAPHPGTRSSVYAIVLYSILAERPRVQRLGGTAALTAHERQRSSPRCQPLPHTQLQSVRSSAAYPPPEQHLVLAVVPPAPAGARYPCSLVVSDSGCPARAAGSPAPLHLKAELQPASNQVSRHLVLRRDCEREAGASMVTRRAWRPGSLYSPAHANEL